MSKFTNFMHKPITWGAVLIAELVCIIIYLISMGWLFRKPLGDMLKSLKRKRIG